MAKDKSIKPDVQPSKRKKSTVDAVEVPVENMMDRVKKKRRKVDIEEAPVQISQVTVTDVDPKQKRVKKRGKKRGKKQMAEKTEIQENSVHHVTVTEDNKKLKKESKCKKKQMEVKSEAPEKTEELVEGEEDLSPEEKRVMERKMKKIMKKEEKKKLKTEGETPEKTEPTGPSAAEQALDYITCFAQTRYKWKFQKSRQTWLLQHMFDSEKVPDEKFTYLLGYLDGLQGGSRETTANKALALVELSGQSPEDTALQQRAQRAKEVIQLLT